MKNFIFLKMSCERSKGCRIQKWRKDIRIKIFVADEEMKKSPFNLNYIHVLTQKKEKELLASAVEKPQGTYW